MTMNMQELPGQLKFEQGNVYGSLCGNSKSFTIVPVCNKGKMNKCLWNSSNTKQEKAQMHAIQTCPQKYHERGTSGISIYAS